jgi:hypothetical protein
MSTLDVFSDTKLKDYGKESVSQFIQTEIKNSNNFETDILNKITYVTEEITEETPEGTITEDRSSRGFYYERLWDICIKFGVTNLTLPSLKNGQLQTSHIINENPNKTNIDFQQNCWSGSKLDGYLNENVRSGNSGGYSDITFLNKLHDEKEKEKEVGEELYFISVKYFKEEKEISKYDIGKLCALIREHEKENRTIKLYIFVKDKTKAIDKFKSQHSSSNILIKYINPGGKYENIYDTRDLHEAYFKLKKLLEQYNYLQEPKNITDFEKTYLNVLKSVFIPRFHQKLFISNIIQLIDKGEKNILVGAIPRSGKSFIMAGTILDFIKQNSIIYPGKKFKFLMMTPAPNETFGEYTDIFTKYIEFEQLGIKPILYQGDVTLKNICSDKDKHCVIIISKQKLGWSSSKAEKVLEEEEQEEPEDSEDEADEADQVEAEAHEVGAEQEEADEELAVEQAGGGGKKTTDAEVTTIKNRITKLLGKNNDINVMFLDEAHFGMSTEKAQQIVSLLNSVVENTVKIYVTATYNKPLKEYEVKPKCKLTWDINDINTMKNLTEATINDNAIEKRFGSDIYSETLEYFGDKSGKTLVDKLKKEYLVYPKPYLITSLWDKDFLNVEKLKIDKTEFGWDMNNLFATAGSSDTFANKEQITEMMRYYFGYPDKKENYDKQSFYRTRGIIPRIRNICANNCRTQQTKHKTTQLWFLPLGNGKIKNKVKALVNLLTESNEFKDIKREYHFFVAVDIEDGAKKGRTIDNVTYMNNPHEIKKDIEAVEKMIKDGKDKDKYIKADNLIILAGQRLQLGITFRNVDIVTLWNSISSTDAIFQMLFRSMTEVDSPPCITNEYCAQKKFGFMVDMNPQRALTNVNLFSENMTKKQEKGEVQQYRQITDLINIDEDVFKDKYDGDEAQKDQFVTDLFNKLYASWNINVENIKQVISKFSFDLEKLTALKDVFKKINVAKNKNQGEPIQEPAEDEFMAPGKKREKIGTIKTAKKGKKPEEIAEINLKQVASELIAEVISLLNIFTLYSDEKSKCILIDDKQANKQVTIIDDIIKLKNKVYEDPVQKDMFLTILNGRLSGNSEEPYPEDVIEGVLDAMNSASDKQIINKIIMTQKKHYYTIHNPNELLEFIDKNLKPKEKEKKENGEVFTPLSLVNEMLDKLDEAYTKEHRKSIFTEPNFTWFDPAVGIGNFPIIVYQRLMKGLETQFPDDEERRKHILEKMLYASELTPKNVFIYKKIFCGDKYKNLNIYEGDTLKMDIKKDFKLPADFIGFDVILGNPPYNKGGIRSHTGKQLGEEGKSETIWPKFIEKSFEWLKPDGFLVFINPLSWLKKSHSLHNAMLEKHIIWLKLWDNSQSKGMINADIPISLYVLENKLNTLNKKTDITSILKRRSLTTTSNEYLNPKYSIPLAFHSIFNKLVGFIETRNLQLEYKTKTIKSSGLKMKLPKNYTLEDMWAVDTYTIKEGIIVKKAIEQHPDANKRKLIIANKASFTGAFIDDGKLGLTGSDKSYILGDNLELLLKLLSFKISDIISHYTKYRQDFLEKEVYTYLPDIRKLGISDITEDEFYELIGLTKQEIHQIKNTHADESDDEELKSKDLNELHNETLSQPIVDVPVKQISSPKKTTTKLKRKLKILTPKTKPVPIVTVLQPPKQELYPPLEELQQIQNVIVASPTDIAASANPLAPAPSKDKIINKKTGRKVNDTPLNRAKNEKYIQSLKKGGKNTRKNTKKNTIKKVYKLKKKHDTLKSKK